MINKLTKHQRVHRSVALYRWQITMRLASQISALQKKRRSSRRPKNAPLSPQISFDH